MVNTAAKDAAANALGKTDDKPPPDRSSTSPASTPELDHEPGAEQREQAEHDAHEQPPQQKRKGGRKPIYATSEERKQRNRQAQAAFRERRTEYIKQLENTIKLHEETLQTLQQSHRQAADECLMLRYKNSLLERILLEKGIDVQAELHAKTGSPPLAPTRASASAGPPPQPIPRHAVNKFAQNRRSLSALPAKSDGTSHIQTNLLPQQSPQAHAAAASHLSSPALSTSKSPNFLPTGGAISPSFGPAAQQNPQLRPQPPLRPQFTAPQRPSLVPTSYPGPSRVSSATASGSAVMSAGSSAGPHYYPSPFRHHYEQLDQEYDAQADMIEDQEPSDTSAGAGSFPPAFNAPMPHGLPHAQPPMPSQGPPQQLQHTPTAEANGHQFSGMNQVFESYDPMLDADPFGLSASMHFPTQFSFDAAR